MDTIEKRSDSVLTDPMQLDWDNIDAAFELLAQVMLPPTYLAVMKSECIKTMLHTRDPLFKDRRYCYLAFFGDGVSSTYLKVGMSKHPTSRMKSLMTGNPLKPMWVFAAEFPDSKTACMVERTLLDSGVYPRAHGEWLAIGSASYDEAKRIVLELKPIAASAAPSGVRFFEIAE